MPRNYIVICVSLIMVMAACQKKSTVSTVPDGSVAITTPNNVDTLVWPLSILQDSTMVIDLSAGLSGKASSTSHWVTIGVDTTELAIYSAKYGAATLLPSSCYLLYKTVVQLPAGSLLSDSAQINIIKQSSLNAYTTYVLPLVIKAVDGKADGAASTQVLYFVFHTGKPAFISKAGWTIAAYSSALNPLLPTNMIDNDEAGTYWASNLSQQMPQYATIAFNTQITFSAVNYYFPPSLKYPTYGGYPTSIRIETSEDGVSFTNNGTFAGNLVNNMQTLNTGITTARYLRFTALACAPYGGTYNCIFISGIKLVP